MAVTNREQAAIRRTLRDIDEGHIGLYVTAKCFDPHTGAPIEPPEILQRRVGVRTSSARPGLMPTTPFPSRTMSEPRFRS